MDDEVDFDQASELQVRDINTRYDPLLVHIKLPKRTGDEELCIK